MSSTGDNKKKKDDKDKQDDKDNKDDKITLYHYTDQKGAQGIAGSGKIKASTDTKNDAVYGAGVYMTSMSPSNHPNKLIQNNYDDSPNIVNSETHKEKVKHVCEVTLDRNEVKKVSNVRDVFLVKGGGDLDLKEKEHKVYENPNMKKEPEKEKEQKIDKTPKIEKKPESEVKKN